MGKTMEKNPSAFNSLACDASISVISERKNVRLQGEFQDNPIEI
jgi:hypothetical protein